MRLLISLFSATTGTWGGLTRAAAIAEAAREVGHVVAFCASGDLGAVLRQRGYQVYPMPPTTVLGLPAPISRAIERRSQHGSLPARPRQSVGSLWLVLTFQGLARGGYLRRLVEAELEAVRDFRADALFTDLDPGAFLVREITRLPLAAAYQSVMEQGSGGLSWRLMRRAETSVLRRFGRPARTPDELHFGPEVLKIVPSIPELDGADPSRPDVCYVGQLLGGVRPLSPTDFEPEPGRRYVFAYVGTGSIPLGVLRRVLPQVFPPDGNVTCLVGAQSLQRPERIGSVELRPYVPAEAVLPHCDWTLCHGGQNTIVQSLLHGVPLLVFPGAIFERRFNAERIEKAGAGLMGEADQFTAEWLRPALARRESLAPRAAALGERIRSYGGALEAVRALESWSGAAVGR